MAQEKDLLISWLNDAYSMENGILRILENHVNDAKDHPQIKAKLQGHLETTRRQADLVKGEITRLGGNVSTSKTFIGNLIGAIQSVSGAGTEDQLVKNCLADFAVENFEIACYRSLITAAQAYGDQELVRTCEQILRQEEEMARWFEQQIPTVTMEVYRKRTVERKAA